MCTKNIHNWSESPIQKGSCSSSGLTGPFSESEYELEQDVSEDDFTSGA